MVFTLFGLLTRRSSHDGCCSKLSFLNPSNKILFQFSWTHFPVNHNKWPNKSPTLTETRYSTRPNVISARHLAVLFSSEQFNKGNCDILSHNSDFFAQIIASLHLEIVYYKVRIVRYKLIKCISRNINSPRSTPLWRVVKRQIKSELWVKK